MDLVLDGRGPIYSQLVRAFKKAMGNGRLPTGARLPASRVLAKQLGLSRATVVKVYEQLRVDGYLAGQVGSGTYVAQPRIFSSPTKVRLPRPVAAQSAYAERLRRIDGATSPFGARPDGIRYAFRYSQPTVDPALADRWVRELGKTAPYVKLGYPPPQGLHALREAITRHIRKTRGVICHAEDILITAGVQQALSLICDVLVDPGDAIVLEEPHYFNARAVFQMKGATIVPVKVDARGLITGDLPESTPKLVYVTPSHQCPTGAVLSKERRLELLNYAETRGTWICEDDYDGEFRHEARPVESLQSIDRSSRVIYVGSFSKTLFPAMRMGYLVAPAALRDDFVKAKWVSDFACSPFEQSALAAFISEGGYDRHLILATKKLAERRAVLRDALREHCGDRVEIVDAGSGMHLLVWVRGAGRADGQTISRHALERGVALYPVEHFYMDPPDRAGFVMGFSQMGPNDIRDAVALFAECVGAVPPRELERP